MKYIITKVEQMKRLPWIYADRNGLHYFATEEEAQNFAEDTVKRSMDDLDPMFELEEEYTDTLS